MRVFKNLFGDGSKIHADEIAVAPGLLLGSAVIVESGSNANGSYVKFGNGTMICMGIYSTDVAISTPWGSLFISPTITVPFAATFVAVPSVSYVLHGSISAMVMNAGNINVGHQSIQLVRATSSPTATRDITYIAIGRWK